MSERWKDESWARTEEFWYSGKVTRRSLLGMGANVPRTPMARSLNII